MDAIYENELFKSSTGTLTVLYGPYTAAALFSQQVAKKKRLNKASYGWLKL